MYNTLYYNDNYGRNEFYILQNAIFPQLQILEFKYKCPDARKDLTEFYLRKSNDSLNFVQV